MYLDRFILPPPARDGVLYPRLNEKGEEFGYARALYPDSIFVGNQLKELCFDKVTILYGSNGCGKSTLLNLIACKLQLNRIAPYNSSEHFERYVKTCKCEMAFDEEGFRQKVPNGSRIITSDDIFDYMIVARTRNEEIVDEAPRMEKAWLALKYGESMRMSGIEDYEKIRAQVLARDKAVSKQQFIKRAIGTEVKLNSNGETALEYFYSKLKNDRLYCLDEPENSLAPKMQIELCKFLNKMARYCGCQLIIATHSPFILAMDNARIYNLDRSPVTIEKWWELENTKTYFDFFFSHKELFGK